MFGMKAAQLHCSSHSRRRNDAYNKPARQPKAKFLLPLNRVSSRRRVGSDAEQLLPWNNYGKNTGTPDEQHYSGFIGMEIISNGAVFDNKVFETIVKFPAIEFSEFRTGQ